MRNILILALCFTFFNAYSVDRVVQENGPVGTFPSISLAVLAAVDGDVIVINNRASSLPWVENITINKSLTFVSSVDNQKFLVQGDYNIERTANREVVINGMQNDGGDISYTGVTVPGIRTKVSILNGDITGSIDFKAAAFDVLISSSIISGDASIFFGKVLGNDISGKLEIATDPNTSNDTISVIGNKLFGSNAQIVVNTISQYVFIANNLLYTSSTNDGILINELKLGINENVIENNSIKGGYNGIEVNGSGAYKLVIVNNILKGYSSNAFYSLDINNTNANILAYYNIYNRVRGIVLNVTNINVSYSSINFSAATGVPSFSAPTDAGNASNEYLDLDLSRNDIGCLGGSYSLNNFHPIADGRSARVSFVKVPRIVNQGTPMKVEAIGFDK